MDDLADQFGIGTLRLTTRQTFHLHGVLKKDLKTVMNVGVGGKECHKGQPNFRVRVLINWQWRSHFFNISFACNF
ncbi:hypothetical protein SASPL_105035 [Salvia splendens]|uniref:Nitrite/Sulfite reductase ferredoxin-like domain-containing protein n=1 Tax=Salvia splendens TaxID=180675 RepID=A0A8X9AAD0_SALSN|nr:hypothetical protein SASPL_105035 [Salvia splendens]